MYAIQDDFGLIHQKTKNVECDDELHVSDGAIGFLFSHRMFMLVCRSYIHFN